MNELSKIKNCLSVKEKRVNISNSKNRNKCGAKVLALMLSAVNLFPGITPYANAADVKEEAKSENSVVRKIKDAGEYVSSLAKRGYTNAITWAKKHPKIATGISAGTLLAIIAAIGGLYYKSLEKSSDESEPKGNNDGQLGVNLSAEIENLVKLEEQNFTSPEEDPQCMRERYSKKLVVALVELKENLVEIVKLRKDSRNLFVRESITRRIRGMIDNVDSAIESLEKGDYKEHLSDYFSKDGIEALKSSSEKEWYMSNNIVEKSGKALWLYGRYVGSYEKCYNSFIRKA